MIHRFIVGAGPVIEVTADTDVDLPAAGWPDSFTGKLLKSQESLLRISSSPRLAAIVNGKVYKFTKLGSDGTFELSLDTSIPSQRRSAVAT